MSSSVGKGVNADVCTCCVGGAHAGVTTSLEEMDFQRSLAGAAQTGNLGRMRGWLARGAKVDGDGESGYAPLHYAARQGHVEACLLLLQVCPEFWNAATICRGWRFQTELSIAFDLELRLDVSPA